MYIRALAKFLSGYHFVFIMQKVINGIQQIGVGVRDAEEAFRWYAQHLGADVKVFDDDSKAVDMAPYMGGEARSKRALMAINMQGGSGYEIWQYTHREPRKAVFQMQTGDLGINCGIIKSRDIQQSHSRLKKEGVEIVNGLAEDPSGNICFTISDPYGNQYIVKEFNSWFSRKQFDLGGLIGARIGVSDMEASLVLYKDILGYNQLIFDETGKFADIPGEGDQSGQRYRRVLLSHSNQRIGGFGRLFGKSELELIQSLDREPRKIFEDRWWGDLGFIHLCFDIRRMHALTQECAEHNFPFRVLSDESFGMGDVNGHFGYIEDPDGTLIEFVETYRVPLVKKLRWHIDLSNRHPEKPLPGWMIRALALKRVRF